MNKRQAYAEGLRFTGHYERWYNRDKVKNIAAVIRKLYKCRVVMVEEDGGVSLFADGKYDAIKGIKGEQWYIDNEASQLQKAREEYEQKITAITSRANCARSYIAAQEEKYPDIKGKTFVEVYDYMREHGIEF